MEGIDSTKELAIIKAALDAGVRGEFLTGDTGLVEQIAQKTKPHLNELAVIEDNGEPVALNDYFDKLRKSNRALFESKEEPQPDMTTEQKVQFVDKHGMDKFVEMRSRQITSENPANWSVRQKTDFIKEHGHEAYMELTRKYKRGSRLNKPGTRLAHR